MKFINSITAYLNQYFGMSRSEARGFMLVLVFTISCIVAPSIVKKYKPQPTCNIKEESGFFETHTNNAPIAIDHHQNNIIIHHKNINPNQLSIEEWQEIGLPFKIATRIVKYVNKGGQFRKQEDLLKIYDFPQNIYAQIKDDLVFESRVNAPITLKQKSSLGKEKLLIDINLADSTEFTKLRGIGVKLAKRIVLYRNSLGGFYSKTQIKEIYGLDSVTYINIVPFLHVDKNYITTQLSLSKTENSVWFKHPYFRKIAKEIIQLKKSKPNLDKATFLEYFSKSETDREKWNAYLQD